MCSLTPSRCFYISFFPFSFSEINDPFQLEMTILGNPVATKFGTMAGFCNAQTVSLGHLCLSFCLESMEKSIHTYRLTPDVAKSSIKTDCEVVMMVAMHIADEPEEDLSWETEALHQDYLTLMTRGGRAAVSERGQRFPPSSCLFL
jgi:hypothetical protein